MFIMRLHLRVHRWTSFRPNSPFQQGGPVTYSQPGEIARGRIGPTEQQLLVFTQALYKARLQTPALGHARVLLSQTSLNKHQITNKIILDSPPARRYLSPPRIGVKSRAQLCPTCVSGCSAYPWVFTNIRPRILLVWLPSL